MPRAVFFDRDNTLIVNQAYLGDPDQVELIEGAADAIARCRAAGYLIVIVSNQSGVARGYFDESAVQAVNQRMQEMLLQDNPGAAIDASEYCPFHPEAPLKAYRQVSDLRKPAPGMLLKAAKEHGIDLRKSWMIGDSWRDMEAGRTAGCRTILLLEESIQASPDAGDAAKCTPDHIATSLKQATDIVLA